MFYFLFIFVVVVLIFLFVVLVFVVVCVSCCINLYVSLSNDFQIVYLVYQKNHFLVDSILVFV